LRIAVIPARGGSKRIPRKNVKHFHGKPIIAYSIEVAIRSECFDKVIVSTDDPEIARISKQYGAEVPFTRPATLADDHTNTIDVMSHAVGWCARNNWLLTEVCCIYPTAPFLQVDDIRKGLQIIRASDVNFVFSVTSFPFPIQRAIKLSGSGEARMFSPEYEGARSQDLEEAYHDAGQFYWGEASSFSEAKSVFSSNSRCVILPRERSQDIDTEEDWKFAEVLFSIAERR